MLVFYMLVFYMLVFYMLVFMLVFYMLVFNMLVFYMLAVPSCVLSPLLRFLSGALTLTRPSLAFADNQTMVDSTAFVLGFFKQYPQFAKNEMYISGESYGGHYVPQLAWYLLQNKLAVNLKVRPQN
jgi:hypothetical protein